MPDGRAYSAQDPDLLTWVHVAEVSSFLAAHLRYRDASFSPAAQERYLAETATIARRLGADEVPESRAEVQAYLQDIRPQLRCDLRTREVARALLLQPVPSPALRPFFKLILEGGQDLLPDWAARLHGFHLSATRRPSIRLGVWGLDLVLHWSLRSGAESRARQRVASLES